MILVAGDYMVDEYWFGEVNRISQEAPVPVVKVWRKEFRDGAAANVAANCRAMGADVRTRYSKSAETDNRVVKIRIIGKNQQISRVDFDHPQEPIKDINLDLINIVLFSDYGKGSLDNVKTLIQEAKSKGITVLVDPKGYDYSRYEGADLVKPNLDEMREMVGGWVNERELTQKAFKLIKDFNIGSILLTRAAEGMTLYHDQVIHIPSMAREVYDVSGAGDTAIAAMAVCLQKGYPLEQAARIANKASGIAVGKFGTAVVTKNEIFNRSD